MSLFGSHHAADTELAIGILRQEQYDVGALDAAELVEDRARAVSQPCAALPLLESFPHHVGEEAHQDVGSDAACLLMPDRADRQFALLDPESSARHSVHPSQTSPNERVRSTRSPLSRTATVCSPVAVSSNSSCRSLPPVICCASSLARARPSPSSSPSCATVSWTTFRPCRTERTSRQYRCTRPPFRTTVCRKYTAPPPRIVAIATKLAPRKAARLALQTDSASSRRISLALPTRRTREIYSRMPNWGS